MDMADSDIDDVIDTEGGRLPTRDEAIVTVITWAKLHGLARQRARTASWEQVNRELFDTMAALGVTRADMATAMRQRTARVPHPAQDPNWRRS